MVERDNQVEHDCTQDRKQDLVKGQGQKRDNQDHHIDGKLEVTGADAEMFLQIL